MAQRRPLVHDDTISKPQPFARQRGEPRNATRKGLQMSTKECLTRQLTAARKVTERLLADFQTPDQWTKQVASQCNHALWFAGHMAHTDNFMISILEPAQAQRIDGFAEKFGTGSVPSPKPEDYP